MADPKLQRTTDVSLAAVFGAIIALSSIIPLSIIVGGIGVFNLTWVMQTLTGILLGPYVGGGAAMAGGIVGETISPSAFGLLGFLRPTLGALQAGLIVWRLWRVAALMLGSLVVVWFLLPIGLSVWPMALFPLLGLAIIVSLGRRLPATIRESKNNRSIFLGWLLTAYCANITRHMFGNIWLALLSLPEQYFWAALPLTVVEQTMFALASAVVGVSTLLAARRARLNIPLIRLEGHPIALRLTCLRIA
ncbi:MAG: hypothetical protein WED04_05780 [Promethearchaeati archaeon SRVP18_Atabeyarchaeia-1]